MQEAVFTNHSMLEESSLTAEAIFRRNVRTDERNPQKFYPPLGHVYSVGLELLAGQRRNSTPDISGFLNYIDNGQEFYNKGVTMMTPAYEPRNLNLVVRYFKSKGLSTARLKKIVAEIVGPNRAENYYIPGARRYRR